MTIELAVILLIALLLTILIELGVLLLMGERQKRVLWLSAFVNVLTNDEMSYLEEAMGLQKGALSIYRQPAEENYWSTANPNGLASVTLRKGDNMFDLSNPSEYIAVKILLANKDTICPSMA